MFITNENHNYILSTDSIREIKTACRDNRSLWLYENDGESVRLLAEFSSSESAQEALDEIILQIANGNCLIDLQLIKGLIE